MLALVLSGAANFGAMQAGAVEVLFEAGLRPDMIVGSSAGALNAIYLAEEPTPAGARRLQAQWSRAGPEEVGVPRPVAAMRRLVTQKDSLVDNAALTEFLKAHLPAGVQTFGELEAIHGIRARAIAVEMETGRLRAFGDDPADRILDGALSSSAVPPYYPPWEVDGTRYLDGGVVSKLPILAALERGASQVVALDVSYAMGSLETAKGILGVSGYALSLMVEVQTATEIAWAERCGVEMRVINLRAPSGIPFWDYTSAARMVEIGKQIAWEELDREPIRRMADWRLKMRGIIRGFRLRPEDHPVLRTKE
jgi:predicted acylesterase/phospholipase RssA